MKGSGPALKLDTTSTDNFPSNSSPGSLTSSIPTISSLPTPSDTPQSPSLGFAAILDPNDGVVIFSDRHLSGVAQDVSVSPVKFNYWDSDSSSPKTRRKEVDSIEKARESPQRMHLRNFGLDTEAYLPPLSEVSDQDSVYSQDSACVVYTSPKPCRPDVTPKSALTFAAVWDPDHGMSTYAGTHLFDQESHPLDDMNDDNDTLKPEDIDYSRFSRETVSGNPFHDSMHPDCEPHLPSRFSCTTTSTSNYVEVDFQEEVDNNNNAYRPYRSPVDDLQPGDLLPGWMPQIFTLGYTRQSSQESQRLPISEPFQLTGSLLTRRPTIAPKRSKSCPSQPGKPDYRSYPPPLPFERSYTASLHKSDALNSPSRRGFGFGSGRFHNMRSASTDTDGASISSRRSSRPSTPSQLRPRLSAVLGRLKSQKRHSPEEGWVIVDVTSVIHQRVVRMDDSY